MNPDHKAEVASCDHDMEEAELEVLGPPSLGIPKPDGSVDTVDTDGEGRDIRSKGTVPGHKCRKCGLEIPTNTCSTPERTRSIVFECEIGFHRLCRVVAVSYMTSDAIESHVVEALNHHAAMGEPVWMKVTDAGQLRTVIRALIESRPEQPPRENPDLVCGTLKGAVEWLTRRAAGEVREGEEGLTTEAAWARITHIQRFYDCHFCEVTR